MQRQTLGFIGLGRMGAPMVCRLIEAGHHLVVYDTRPDAAKELPAEYTKFVASPKAVADEADIVFCSLPTPPVVKEVVLGANGIATGAKVRIIVDVSTTGPSMAKTISEALTSKGIAWVDAPISGGIAGARNGTLAVMVSCPKQIYEEIEPVLANFGRRFYCGETPGSAQVAKLGNNMIAAGVILLSAEALAMGVKAGLDPTVMCDIINASSGRNSATQDKFPRAVLPGTFDFGFSTALSYKDVRMCVDESENLGVPMVGGSLVRQMLAATNARFGPDSDFTSMVRIIEEWAGVEIRA
ncbi:NAD(P)-dependent oxidoreductase [Mesorhizobium sp. YC-39]|uniref:NAD(P)-dependent oxidoreductase n=1 Tax=unclassified Mesorhizobium TaxID=325217 RepID=UPI0021E8EB5F|nr:MULTISPECIES: NAD(P)-dependent oxidoreductase [unclassified Mesorhizobium]MCV3210740.1 NAD(P)-dependent oxidoreductase [Mesorhizobium sp. YC-2]MCV3230974.1 NAD(P)-dependent oxidoreductase [Mesorhizobium sp. YC-39]